MSKRLLPVLLLAAIALLFSCKKENGDLPSGLKNTERYYPLAIGKYIEYDVDSIKWSDFSKKTDTLHLTMRYTVDDTFRDLTGALAYSIDVQQRGKDSVWRMSQVISATPTELGVDVMMNNLRFKKLVFPVTEGRTWQGNRAIDTNDVDNRYYGGWVYEYSEVGKPYFNGLVNYPVTVTITAINDSLNNPDLIDTAYAERTLMREVYAYDIGLVSREFIHWTYDPGTLANRYRSGVAVTMRATTHN